jgi:acetyltransferase-like isoleucine patch superfamily enzyme
MHMKYDIGLNDTYRYKNIVYVSVPKCASTYIKGLLQQIPFAKTNFSEINEDDKIFAFIKNPRERHISALEQKITDSNAFHLMKDKAFLNFLHGIAIGDDNMIPYNIRFKSVTKQTLFLPCDSEKHSVTNLLKRYFDIHCPEIDHEKINYDVERNSSLNYGHNEIPDLRTRTRKFLDRNLYIHKGMFAMIYDEDFETWKTAVSMAERNLDQYLVSKY